MQTNAARRQGDRITVDAYYLALVEEMREATFGILEICAFIGAFQDQSALIIVRKVKIEFGHHIDATSSSNARRRVFFRRCRIVDHWPRAYLNHRLNKGFSERLTLTQHGIKGTMWFHMV